MKKNGFTLVELLAVIVVLAIIALIATPIVLNVIEKSKKNAAIDSAYGYIEAIETQNQLAQLNPDRYSAIESGSVTGISVNVKGKKPSSGTVTITKGKVNNASDLCINGYIVNYDGKEATVDRKCNEEKAAIIQATSVGMTPENENWKVNGTTVSNISDALDSLYENYEN